MDKGILFEFGNVHGEEKERDLLLTTDEIMTVSVRPNEVVEIKNPYIQPLTNTVPFYLRAKLDYIFYSGDTEITPADKASTLAEILVLDDAGNAFTFHNDFLPDANNEWFYYCANAEYATAGKNQLVALTENSAQVDLFATTNLTVQNFNVEFGSPNEVTKIQVVLIVEALQTGAEDVYGLPADGNAKGATGSSETVVDFESGEGSLTYLVDGENVEITAFSGTDIVITETDMQFAEGKTISFDASILEEYEFISVYDKELLEYFVYEYYTNQGGSVNILTSQELYDYISGIDENGYLDWYIFVG